MREKNLEFVQNQINYTFKNEKLLVQAFRKENSQKNADVNYEVIEFYGDKILGFLLSKKLCSENSLLSLKGNLHSQMSEGELSKEFVKYSNNEYLAERIELLGFKPFFIKNHYQNLHKVSRKALGDLFEAILGAVAVDCNWNIEILDKVCERMLIADLNDNISENDILDFCTTYNLGRVDFYTEQNGKNYVYTVRLSCLQKEFSSFSKSLEKAKTTALRKTLNFLDFILNENLPEELSSYDKLCMLYKMNYMPEAQFYFHTEEKDCSEWWICECEIKGFDKMTSGAEKDFEEAKKNACDNMLSFIFDTFSGIEYERPQKKIILAENSNPEIDDCDENQKTSLIELDYVSQLYNKANKKEIERPEFEFEDKENSAICKAKIGDAEWETENITRKLAKQDVCRLILEKLAEERKMYMVE